MTMRRFAFNPAERALEHNPYKRNFEAHRVAQAYLRSMDMPPLQETPYVKNDVQAATQIALVYADASDQSHNPEVQAAYRQLNMELEAQLSVIPIEFVPFTGEGEPYPDSPAMMEDVLQNNRMFVFGGGEDNPMMSRQQTFVFRSVHDYFGHAMMGFAFGPRGEENAWMEHAKMFTPLARAALTTETRGQNSWVNFGPYADLPPSERPFAEQKAFLLPVQFRTRPELQEAYRNYPGWIEEFEYAA